MKKPQMCEADLTTLAQEGFDAWVGLCSLTSLVVSPFVTTGETNGLTFMTGEEGGFAVVGLSGDELLMVVSSTELNDSLVWRLLRENVECAELTRVLELLPGSLLYAGRIGVDGRLGTGSPLGRLVIFAVGTFWP